MPTTSASSVSSTACEPPVQSPAPSDAPTPPLLKVDPVPPAQRSLTPARRRPLRSRRLLGATLSTLLLASSLAACGSDETAAGSGASTLDAVEVSGEVGATPEISITEEMTAGDQDTETLVEGDGVEIGDGDQVIVNFWLGNGYNQEPVESSYKPKTVAVLATVGGTEQQPQTLDDVIGAAAADLVEPGTTVGSRVATVGSPQDVLGLPGLPDLGIGNMDPVVLVVDLEQEPLSAPSGQKVDAPDWVPTLQSTDGTPTAWDFSGTPEPTDQLRSFATVVGDGPEVAEGDLLVVDYLGQVYGGKKPFDDSYSRGEPVGFGIGVGQVIQGWDRALVGQTVGSRVVLAIPPRLGYGEQGSPQAGIEGTDTLYFVVDVLGAA